MARFLGVCLSLLLACGDDDSSLDSGVGSDGGVDATTLDASGDEDAGVDGGLTDADPDSSDASVDPLDACEPGSGPMYSPTSASDVAELANTGATIVLTDSFDCTDCTFAPDQTLIPSGGVISGTGIDLNGACIVDDFSVAFASDVRFVSPYSNSRLSPEIFGAVSGDDLDDSAAIDALVVNAEYAIGAADGVYVKNQPSTYDRMGVFDWDMNGCRVEITSAASFRLTQVSVDAVFDITTLSPRIRNGEFDGNELYGRLFYLHGQPEFSFNDLWVHDLYSPSPIRAVAFRFSIDVEESGFTSGEFRNNRIENVVSEGNGNFNDTDGISKAWWYSMSGVEPTTTYSVVHQGNVVRNIIGDDAEAFYAIQGGGTHTHSGTWLLDDEDYSHCTRRAVKFCLSNVTIQNSRIEEIPNDLFRSAQQMGSMVDFFSTQSTNLLENITVTGNTIRTVDGAAGHYHFISLTEIDGALIANNTIEMTNLENYAGVRLGSGTSSYRGVLRNVEIRDNDFHNAGVQLLTQYAPDGQVIVRDNTFDYTYDTSDNWGANQAALRCTNTSGTRGNIDFIGNTITVDTANNTSLFNGVIFSQGSQYVNTRIEGVTIRYVDAGVTRPFGYIQGNFDASNSIASSRLEGAPGTGALVVDGSAGVVITDSFGDGSTPITVE